MQCSVCLRGGERYTEQAGGQQGEAKGLEQNAGQKARPTKYNNQTLAAGEGEAEEGRERTFSAGHSGMRAPGARFRAEVLMRGCGGSLAKNNLRQALPPPGGAISTTREVLRQRRFIGICSAAGLARMASVPTKGWYSMHFICLQTTSPYWMGCGDMVGGRGQRASQVGSAPALPSKLWPWGCSCVPAAPANLPAAVVPA